MSTSAVSRCPENTEPAPPWTRLGPAPHAPLRAFAAERLFRRAVRDLPVRIVLAGGERLGAGGTGTPLMRVERPEAFFHRLGADAKIGFGEAYMAGDWSSPDPAALLTPFAARMSTLVPAPLQHARHWVERRQPAAERGTRSGARSNIARHYDLSNDVFATFLDETMTYSGGWFSAGDDLAAAQRRKIDGILDLAHVGSGTNLLEIGTGWGSLAIRAAERGAVVTTVTLSAEQQRLARERVAAAGMSDRVEVLLCDYRDVTGRYDAVVSVEMIEAVGHEFWPTYFSALDRLLVPGGRVGLQAITMPHSRMRATRNSYTWIHKYVFPGGLIPSVRAIDTAVARYTGLVPAGRRFFGDGYAETLRQWRARFLRGWEELARLGFDERFRRMWEFYLAYSEAGFRAGYLDVGQFGFLGSAGK
ncbi:SAM-dependent methyltransferase [Actinopolyspora mortivallis]|uniref:SAM-dependent methyltransferase n=1 Tax=Actinopolyspora mortivallis TaxID=33906 RepID=UPI0003704138|nr:cyclopropane-fatty-acyl-phospholipid synthase family protein [Actinopolyspora mortivallis]